MKSNIIKGKKVPLTSFRTLAIGSWAHSKSPEIYSQITLPIDQVLQTLSKYNKDQNCTVNTTHFFAKALAICLHKYPDLNTVLIRNSLYYRNTVQLFFQTVFKDNSTYDLSGISIECSKTLSLKALSIIVTQKTKAIRKKQDTEINTVRKLLKQCPAWLSPVIISMMDFILYTCNLSLEKYRIPKDRMGSAMISNIGSLGIQQAYAPLFPTCRCPLSITIGKKHDHTFIRNKKVEIKQAITISFTADHRYFDGSHVAKAIKTINAIFQSPELILNWE